MLSPDVADEFASKVVSAWSGDELSGWIRRFVEKEVSHYCMTRGLGKLSGELIILSAPSVFLRTISQSYVDKVEHLSWLKKFIQTSCVGYLRAVAIQELSNHFIDTPAIISILEERAEFDQDMVAFLAAIRELLKIHGKHPKIFVILKKRAELASNSDLQCSAIKVLSDGWDCSPDLFATFCEISTQSSFERKADWQNNPRRVALEALLTHHPTHPKTIELLRDRAINDPDEQLRAWAQEQLQKMDIGK